MQHNVVVMADSKGANPVEKAIKAAEKAAKKGDVEWLTHKRTSTCSTT